MKDLLTDANFPRTADQRVYHLGLRPGEVANRIITVGSPSRAKLIAKFLDADFPPFELYSERGFLTITGRYKQVPISIVSIGMGSPNMDFFVREIRECLKGDMVVVRLGSCGALIDVPVGTIVIPKACVAVNRNVDFGFTNPENNDRDTPYWISKPVSADSVLHSQLANALEMGKPTDWTNPILSDSVNASGDSFYSSQGRQTSFPDHNSDLLERLHGSVPDLATLEMETFHLYHLASCWTGGSLARSKEVPPLTTSPVRPSVTGSASTLQPFYTIPLPDSIIRAAAVQMVFASRLSQGFISPDQVAALENWTGKAVLDAVAGFEISAERLETESGSVWQRQK